MIESAAAVPNEQAQGSAEDSNERESNDPWKDEISVEDASEAILIEILTQAEDLADELNLGTDTELRVGEILTKAWKTNFMHGRSKERTVAAAVYLATRERDQTIPPGNIARESSVTKSDLKHTYKALRSSIGQDLPPAAPADYIEFICDRIGASRQIQEKAATICSQHEALPGNPVGVAAASVYLSAEKHGHETTLREVAALVDMTKETVWSHKSNLESGKPA